MISTFIIWLYIFFVSVTSGHLLFNICTRIFKTGQIVFPNLAESSFFGIAGIGVILSYSSIFYKTGLAANLFILMILLIYFISQPVSIISYYKIQLHEFLSFPVIIKVLSAIYFIMILMAAQSFPKIYDTGLYHAQFIQWLSSYKTIPGLGNLHGRFAYNNQSFLLESFFSFSFIKTANFHLLNSYLLLVISLSLIVSLYRSITSGWLKTILYLGLLILFQIFHLSLVSSPTPDIFSTIGTWFVLLIFLNRISAGSENRLYWIIILLVTLFLVTVKLSSVPLVLVAVFFLFIPDWTFLRKSLVLSILGLLVFVPFFIRNYFISGYLVYPLPSIDFFNPDWKIPVSYVTEMKTIITSFAQCRDWQVRPFREWLPIWFAGRSIVFKGLSVFLLLSPFLMIAALLVKKNIIKIFREEIKVLIICFIAIVFWFFTAPNFRFVYGFLFIYLLISLTIYLHILIYELRISEKLKSKMKKLFSGNYPKFIYVVLLAFPLVFFINCDYSEITKCVVHPAPYSAVQVKTVTVNNFKVSIPEDNAQCWDACIPCSIIQKNIGITDIEMRGNDLKYGFRVKKK